MLSELAPLVDCPNCGGTGQAYSVLHHSLWLCEMCWGKRWLPAATCRGCGRPATKYWPPKQRPIIQYCGLESCFSALVVIHRPVGSKPRGYRPSPGIVIAVQDIMKNNTPEHKNQMENLRQDLLRRELDTSFHVAVAKDGWEAM
jgi:hypothetical protein